MTCFSTETDADKRRGTAVSMSTNMLNWSRRFPAGMMALLVLLLGSSAQWVCAEEFYTEDAAVREACPEALAVTTNWAVLKPDQVTAIGAELAEDGLSAAFKYRTIALADHVTNYAAVSVEPGKHGPITFMVFTDVELRVVRVLVLDMKEVRGKPIAKQSFLSQYIGKGPDDSLRVGYEVEGITGATISSTAATVATRKVLLYLKAVLGSTASGDTASEPATGEQTNEPTGLSASEH